MTDRNATEPVRVNCADLGAVIHSGYPAHLHSSELSVWHFRVSGMQPLVSYLSSILNTAELERSSRHYRDEDKENFIICRGILRVLLSRYLMTEPSEIVITEGKNKKPYAVADQPLHFNLSHSGDLLLIAVHDLEVGIDVEMRNEQFEYNEVMPRVFSETEIRHIENSSDSRASFYKLWTTKESLVKGTNKGIDDDLVDIPSLTGLHHIDPAVLGSNHHWELRSFSPDEGYAASLAYIGGVPAAIGFYSPGLSLLGE